MFKKLLVLVLVLGFTSFAFGEYSTWTWLGSYNELTSTATGGDGTTWSDPSNWHGYEDATPLTQLTGTPYNNGDEPRLARIHIDEQVDWVVDVGTHTIDADYGNTFGISSGHGDFGFGAGSE